MARRGQLTAAGSTSLAYDQRGNLTSNGSVSYVYDHENRLVYASGPTPTGLFYDPLGRLWKTQDSMGANHYFLYDGNELTAEYNNSGALVRRFVWGSGVDEPIIQDDDSSPTCAGTKFLHADRLGSIVATADCWGARLAANSYDEYGNPGAGNVGRFQYTGQMWMPELGLQYSKARMYSPALGRFMQTDPIGFAGGSSLHAYVRNDPVNRTDPTGLVYPEVVCNGVLATVCGQLPRGGEPIELFGAINRAGPADRGNERGGGRNSTTTEMAVNNNRCQQNGTFADLAKKFEVAADVTQGAAILFGIGAVATSETVVGGVTFGILASSAGVTSLVASGLASASYAFDKNWRGAATNFLGVLGGRGVSAAASRLYTRPSIAGKAAEKFNDVAAGAVGVAGEKIGVNVACRL